MGDEEVDYVVIGAGVAGLTAARALHQLGAKGTHTRSTGGALAVLRGEPNHLTENA